VEHSVPDFAIRILLGDDKRAEFRGPADITKESTHAIVNAANSSLLGGGGVDGAIHEAGGPSILAECRRIVKQMGTLPAGGAVITAGGRLTAKYVIHTVGPIYRGGDQGEEKALESCHRESIRLADEYWVDSLSFPAISTGAYGYPVSAAAGIAVSAVAEGLRSTTHLKMVRFVLFDVSTLRAYTRAGENLRDPKDGSPYRIERSTR
jgi:O-acetyl-ADP-ribose deacetylase (regulator of RNase III)